MWRWVNTDTVRILADLACGWCAIYHTGSNVKKCSMPKSCHSVAFRAIASRMAPNQMFGPRETCSSLRKVCRLPTCSDGVYVGRFHRIKISNICMKNLTKTYFEESWTHISLTGKSCIGFANLPLRRKISHLYTVRIGG